MNHRLLATPRMLALVLVLGIGSGLAGRPQNATAQTGPPQGADCTIGRSTSEVWANKSKKSVLVTVEVKNLGQCLVRVGSPSDMYQVPRNTGDVQGGRTESFTFECGPKGTNDAQGHATDVIAASCDDTVHNQCLYEVKVTSVSAVR